MKNLLLGTALVLAPFAASAQEVTISGGVAVATSYDLTANSGAEAEYPLSFYMQAEKNGFYGQLWFGLLPAASAPDQVEMDVVLGWSGEVSPGLELGVAYAAYFLDDSGYDTSELIGSLTYALSDKVSTTLEVAYDIEAEETDTSLGLDYALTDKWALHGLVGRETATPSTYYEVGVTYAVTEEVSLNVLFEDDDTAGNKGALTFTMAYDF